jgi:hypothetical protein
VIALVTGNGMIEAELGESGGEVVIAVEHDGERC